MAIKLITTDLDMSLNGKCRDQLQENFTKIEDGINKINNQISTSEEQNPTVNATNIKKIIEILAKYDVPIGLDDKGNVIKTDQGGEVMAGTTITLDTYKQQIGSQDAFSLSSSFNGRVGDEQLPLEVVFKEHGQIHEFGNELVPFVTGFVGPTLDDDGKITAANGTAVSYIGSRDDIVGLGRVKMRLPGTMFPQEGYFYGFLGLETPDGSQRESTFSVWFHVYNGNPDMFINKEPFRSELQKLLDDAQADIDIALKPFEQVGGVYSLDNSSLNSEDFPRFDVYAYLGGAGTPQTGTGFYGVRQSNDLAVRTQFTNAGNSVFFFMKMAEVKKYLPDWLVGNIVVSYSADKKTLYMTSNASTLAFRTNSKFK